MIARWFAVLTCAAVVTAGGVAVAPSALAADGTYHLTAKVAQTSPRVDDNLTVVGKVTDATSGTPVAGVTVSVTRRDRTGTQPTALTSTPTGSDGGYSVDDPVPAVWGTVTYVVTVVGDMSGSSAQASAYVRRLNPRVTITPSKTLVTFGHPVRVTAHLGSATTTRTLTIYARPYDRDRRRIANAVVDAQGNLSASYTMHRRTRFIVTFAGDDRYYPTSAYVVVRARAVIYDHLSGYFDTSGAYRIYHAGDSPELDARLFPNLYHVCLYFRAQYYSGGRWHRASVSPCVRTGAAGRAAALLNNALALPYRLRAEWRGSTVATAAHGPWRHLRFR